VALRDGYCSATACRLLGQEQTLVEAAFWSYTTGSQQLTDGSVFFGQHDGDDALGDRGIGRIR
jgi:hypothetical protein